MTKLRRSFSGVKSVYCLRAGLSFAVLLALLFQMGRLPVVQSLSLNRNGVNAFKPAPLRRNNVTPPLIEEPAVSHLLVASYYTLEDGMTSMLTLKNKGPQPIAVNVTLFNQNGQSFAAPQTSVPGLSAVEINLSDWVGQAGQSFRSGNIQATYTGRMMELGAHLRISNPARSLIFDEHFIEDAQSSSSSRLEGVFSLPFSSADASLVLTNTSDRRISVDGFVSGRKQHPIFAELNAHATRTIIIPGGVKNFSGPTNGAISLRHEGGEGVLLARLLVQDAARGFSTIAECTDPGKRKSAQLHGAGIHLSLPQGEPLQQIIVARNLDSVAASVQGRVRYTSSDNASGTVELPALQLAPGEVKAFNTSNPSLYQPNVVAAGLELEATGVPGNVIASAYSMSNSGWQSFSVPLLDPAAQRSSSGGYPWSIEGTSSTIVFIKNTTSIEQKFTGEFTHSGGTYNLGLKRLAAGETLALDLKALRDDQSPDASGNRIATDATSGHVRWSVHGPVNLTLIGRAEQVDIARGMVSSFSCQTCCPERFYDGWLNPNPINSIVGDTMFLAASQRNIDCYEVVSQPFSLSPFYWSSSNSGVISVDNSGYAEAESEGTATMEATWDIVTRWFDFGGICQAETGYNSAQQPAQVVTAKVNIAS